MGWGENDRGVSFTFGAEVAAKFLHKHDFDLICRAHQVRILPISFKLRNRSRSRFRFLIHRLLRTATSSSPSGNWSRSSPRRTTAESSTTRAPWCPSTRRSCAHSRSSRWVTDTFLIYGAFNEIVFQLVRFLPDVYLSADSRYGFLLTCPYYLSRCVVVQFDALGTKLDRLFAKSKKCLHFAFQPADKKKFPYGGINSGRPVTPPRGGNQKKGKK